MSSFCQEIYPKILIVNTDTFVVVNKEQVYKINTVYARFNNLKEYSNNLNNIVIILNEKINLLNNNFNLLKDKEEKLILQNINLKDLNEINNNLVQRYREEIKYQKVKRMKTGFFSFITGAVLGSIVIFIVK